MSGTYKIVLATALLGMAAYLVCRRKRDFIPGGRAAGRLPSEFPEDQLRKGIRVEMEHTNDPRIATEIAMDHLVEDPRYYDKLAKIHQD